MKNLKNTLTLIHHSGIKTRQELVKSPALYASLFLDIDHFITDIVFRSHRNISNLQVLCNLGGDIDDIHMSCLERCIIKLDRVLSKDLDAQIPYLYRICNHKLIDIYRKLKDTKTVSLNAELSKYNALGDSKKEKTFEDYLMDKKNNTESDYITKSMAAFEVLNVLNKYHHNADWLLCSLAVKIMEDKPSELAQVIIEAGSVDAALASYLHTIQDVFEIPAKEIPVIAPAKATGLSKVLLKKGPDDKALSGKISNILNRIKPK